MHEQGDTKVAEREIRLLVEGMDCGSCALKIETALRRLPGVADVAVALSSGSVVVSHDGRAAAADMSSLVTALGFTVRETAAPAAASPGHRGCGHHHGHDDAPDHSPSALPWWRSRRGRQIIGCGMAVLLAYAVGRLFPQAEQWAFLAAALAGLVPIVRQAAVAARLGTPFSIEMLMSVAAVGGMAIGAAEEAAAVVFLFLVGESLEGVAAGRARAGIRTLIDLLPRTALRESGDGHVHQIAADNLRVDDVIMVRPGDRIPADGLILTGSAGIDESPVTGESLPKAKGTGERVFAGTICLDGLLRVTVTADATDNTIARIVRMVEEAQDRKAPVSRAIDRFARVYTPAITAMAAGVMTIPPLLLGGAWAEWVYKGLAVLLIGCPCALVISTPAAIAAGLSVGARRGLLMKGGAVLEMMGRVTTVAFDKTGTLTRGKPRVTDLYAIRGDSRSILAVASGLSAGSGHPLARAILDKAAEDGIVPATATHLDTLAGRGVTGIVDGRRAFLGSLQSTSGNPEDAEPLAQAVAFAEDGKTVSVLVIDDAVAGIIAFQDELRPDARAGVTALRNRGIAALIVTGDHAAAARAVSRMLDIPAHASLLPEDKLHLVRERQARGERVAKVGDGINDAPALAAADVGIAMGGGSDVTLETANAAILHGRVSDVAAMVDLSRRTLANIRQNMVIALGLKAAFLVTTIAGLTGLWPAVLADTGATVLVTANALRLLRDKHGPSR